MGEWKEAKLVGRARLTGIIKLETGMHIGKSRESLQIGGLDCNIVRDPFSGEPYIPGSSFKGKMRCLGEKVLLANGDIRYGLDAESHVGGELTIYRHECPTAEVAVSCPVCRLFGTNGDPKTLARYKKRLEKLHQDINGLPKIPTNFPARITVWDAFLSEPERYRQMADLPYAEWKSENTIDRLTAAANPRQMERAARGLEFEFCLSYDIKPDNCLVADLENMLVALWLVEQSGLGGNISRGYGRISMKQLRLQIDQYRVTSKSGQLAQFYHENRENLTLDAESLAQLREKTSNEYREKVQSEFLEACLEE